MKHHETANQLLPWFINGSLNETEHTLVNAHLKICDVCQREVNELIHVSKQFNDPSIDGIWEGSRRKARAQFLTSLGAHAGEPDITDHHDSLRRPEKSTVVTLASFACLLLLASIMVFISPSEDKFETLSMTRDATTPIVQIVFSPNATNHSINKVLFAKGNTVLSGPTRHGVYRICTIGVVAGIVKPKHTEGIMI